MLAKQPGRAVLSFVESEPSTVQFRLSDQRPAQHRERGARESSCTQIDTRGTSLLGTSLLSEAYQMSISQIHDGQTPTEKYKVAGWRRNSRGC